MSNDTQFKKEVQDRKKNYQDKKVELISRLCNDDSVDEIKAKEIKDQNRQIGVYRDGI